MFLLYYYTVPRNIVYFSHESDKSYWIYQCLHLIKREEKARQKLEGVNPFVFLLKFSKTPELLGQVKSLTCTIRTQTPEIQNICVGIKDFFG